jgi:hypothetical protein
MRIAIGSAVALLTACLAFSIYHTVVDWNTAAASIAKEWGVMTAIILVLWAIPTRITSLASRAVLFLYVAMWGLFIPCGLDNDLGISMFIVSMGVMLLVMLVGKPENEFKPNETPFFIRSKDPLRSSKEGPSF